MSITCGRCGTQLFSGTVNSSVRCVQCDINDLYARASEYRRKLREERAENARLRRQVERLVGLVSKAYYSLGNIPYLDSEVKYRLDAILADEPGETE